MRYNFISGILSVIVMCLLTASHSAAKAPDATSGSKSDVKKANKITICAPLLKSDDHIKEPVVKKLAELILSGREEEIEQPPLNPEEDVTDDGGNEGKNLLNQTTYLRKAGIDPEKMSLGGSPDNTIKRTVEHARLRYYTSLIDFDNDGEKEIRFHSVQGTLKEEDNYFFKKGKDGAYKLIECDLGGEKMLGFVKLENRIYTTERNPENQLKTIAIYNFDNGKFKCLSTIDVHYSRNRKSITISEEPSNN